MKVTAGTAQLAIMLHEPDAVFREIARRLREGARELSTEARGLARRALEAGYPCRWDFEDLFRGKPGVGGGADLTLASLTVILVAYLSGGRRDHVARKTLALLYAPATTHWPGWKETATWPPVSEPDESVKICPRTGERFFGSALIKVLSDPVLRDAIDEVAIYGDRDAAMLEFRDTSITSFVRWPPGKPGTYSGRHLPVFVIRPLIDMLNEEAESSPSAA